MPKRPPPIVNRYRIRNAKGATFETSAASHAAALERAAQVGFADPVYCGLIDPDPDASRARAITAWATLKGPA